MPRPTDVPATSTYSFGGDDISSTAQRRLLPTGTTKYLRLSEIPCGRALMSGGCLSLPPL
jgi:hypothetical protein